MNKTLKSILAMLLVLCFVFGAAGCGDSDKEDGKQTVNEQSGTVDESSAGNSESTSASDSSESKKDDKTLAYPLPEVPEYTDTDENGNAKRDPNYQPINYEQMKGIWLSQFDMQSLYQTSGKQTNETAFTLIVDKICAGVAAAGFNTIIVQLRPNGDSFYPSDLYCPSKYVVGLYGAEFDYDMLRIFIKTAHDYGLSFHGWVNPMRLMSASEITYVSEDYVIGKWYNDEEQRNAHLAKSGDLYYLIPGVQENQQLVWDGVTEICTNYNIDAIHIDDYFYPTTDKSFDREHFLTQADNFGGDNDYSLRLYRLDMVNQLVAGMYDAVKAVDEDIWFGISPAGNIDNNLSTLYASVTTWCSTPGFCDYIVPQVYWGFEHSTNGLKFDNCCENWAKYNTAEEVRLVIGIGIYRISDTSDEFAEYRKYDDVTKRQLEYVENMEKADGFVLYSFGNLFDNSGSLKNGSIKKERENFIPVVKIYGGEEGNTLVPVS